jgi:hypothetical protein
MLLLFRLYSMKDILGGTKLVVMFVVDFWTRVQCPPAPPVENCAIFRIQILNSCPVNAARSKGREKVCQAKYAKQQYFIVTAVLFNVYKRI